MIAGSIEPAPLLPVVYRKNKIWYEAHEVNNAGRWEK
jgi:hypothetical protein